MMTLGAFHVSSPKTVEQAGRRSAAEPFQRQSMQVLTRSPRILTTGRTAPAPVLAAMAPATFSSEIPDTAVLSRSAVSAFG